MGNNIKGTLLYSAVSRIQKQTLHTLISMQTCSIPSQLIWEAFRYAAIKRVANYVLTSLTKFELCWLLYYLSMHGLQDILPNIPNLHQLSSLDTHKCVYIQSRTEQCNRIIQVFLFVTYSPMTTERKKED